MKYRIHRAAGLLAAMLALVCTPVFAHHGWSDYDGDHPLTLKGRIQAASYENPHAGEVRAERIVFGEGSTEKTVELR